MPNIVFDRLRTSLRNNPPQNVSEHWVPAGYSEPQSYEKNERWIIVTAVLLSPLAIPAAQRLEFVSSLPTWFTGRPVASMAAVLGMISVTTTVVVCLHETLHFVTAAALGYRPVFRWSRSFYWINPSVAPYGVGIARWESAAMLAAPVVIISPIAAALMLTFSGMFGTLAAFAFLINTIPSCSDVYQLGRLLRLPRGTLITNVNQNGELHTEYATPSAGSSPSS